MARRRSRRTPETPKPHPNARWARDFLKPTKEDLERERLRKENTMLREKLDLANDLVVEARLRVRSGRR